MVAEISRSIEIEKSILMSFFGTRDLDSQITRLPNRSRRYSYRRSASLSAGLNITLIVLFRPRSQPPTHGRPLRRVWPVLNNADLLPSSSRNFAIGGHRPPLQLPTTTYSHR